MLTNILIFFCCFTGTYCLTGKVCYNRAQSGEEIRSCCADFEDGHGVCIPCNKGYTSDQGERCRPCSENTFGFKCAYSCTCNRFQKCDHVLGCIEINISTVTFLTIPKSTETTRNFDSNSTGDNLHKRGVNIGLVPWEAVLGLSIVVLVLVTALCWVCMRSRQKYVINNKTRSTFEPPVLRNNSRNNEVLNIEMSESPYDTVDESDMDELDREIIAIPEYFDVISGTDSSKSYNSDFTVYLDPVYTLANINIQHGCNDGIKANTTEQRESKDEDSIRQYQSLTKNRNEQEHIYRSMVVVHSHNKNAIHSENSTKNEVRTLKQIGKSHSYSCRVNLNDQTTRSQFKQRPKSF